MSQFTFGPVLRDNGALFRLWGPKQKNISLVLGGGQTLPMQADADGWFNLFVAGAKAGTRYAFQLEDGLVVPDPASRFQPDDVHAASELIDHDDFEWHTPEWANRPWKDIVLYELHIGTFTAAGTFTSAIDRLDYLRELGITGIQLMPVNAFRGQRGWGYDGVLPYAVENSYGRPEELMAFIDAAHHRGICVFLDVVYNHFGPDGNYLPLYAPLFTDKHKSPWGDGINYDGDGSLQIRRLIVENVLYWLTVFKVDGLRFDAVHAIQDESDVHLLGEIATRAREIRTGQPLHLIVENEDNAVSLLRRESDGRAPLYTAQWNDDVHHVLHASASGEDFGYYADYAHDPDKLGRALAEGFVYQGEVMPYRGSARGQPSAHLPPQAFIAFIQNHDQIGNRAYGDRLQKTTSREAMMALASVYLLLPQVPMIFMGEEWMSKAPFPYFCDFDDDLNAIVRKGRREELSRLPGFDEESAKETPDPTARTTFLSAKLDWHNAPLPGHADILDHYKHLLETRRLKIAPLLDDIKASGTFERNGPGIIVSWSAGSRHKLVLCFNPTNSRVVFPHEPPRDAVYARGWQGNEGGPWAVSWTILPTA